MREQLVSESGMTNAIQNHKAFYKGQVEDNCPICKNKKNLICGYA